MQRLAPWSRSTVLLSTAIVLALTAAAACSDGDDDPLASDPPEATQATASPNTAATEPQTTSPTTAPATPAGPCAGPGGVASLPADPGGSDTPSADSYTTAAILSTDYLGDFGGSLIEFAMIPGHTDQAIVANQDGLIYRVSLSGAFGPQLWGDLSGRVTVGGEQGLLSVAFSPTFEQDCRVYAYYTPGAPAPTLLARYTGSVEALNEASEEVLLEVEEFAANHNGGHIAFDAAGYLYLSLGDGGGGGDPEEASQDLTRLLGKVVRLDVSGESGYAIPPDNPFNDGSGPNRDEIFAYGLRNPWRMTIDPISGDTWVGDVGQSAWEEVNLITAGGNYGWDCYEGFDAFESDGCPDGDLIFPRAVHEDTGQVAITGGVVYRGDDLPELYGWYVYGDFYSGEVFALDTASTADPTRLFDSDPAISSFTLMPDGEVAIVTYNSGVLRLTR